MSQLNIAFDGKSSDELFEFVQANREFFSTGRIHIKINDMLAEIGIKGLKELQSQIQHETRIEITWMIDGKWYDIPNTVAHYVKRLEGLNVAYYTVHASGGREMIRAAKEAAPDKKLLAITVLTSMSEDETRDIYDEDRAKSILRLASVALAAGADGLVCSPSDVSMLREVFSEKYGNFLLVTPNIARTGIERNDDQNKSLTTTPRQAIENGSSDIVVGRPILSAENPSEVIREMLLEMDSVHVGGVLSVTNDSLTTAEKFVDWVYKEGIIELIPEGRKIKSGRISPHFFNAGLFNTGTILSKLASFYAQTIIESGIEYDVLFGPAYKGITLASATAEALGKIRKQDAFAFNRKEAKDHGEGGTIVGAKLAGKRVFIVEDVITDGGAKREAIEIIRAQGGTPVGIIIAFDRCEKGLDTELSGKMQIEQDYGIPLLTVATIHDLLSLLAKKNDDFSREMHVLLCAYLEKYGVKN